MRGEESTTHLMTFPSAELPPHARRRGLVFPMPAPFSGITSACAEKRSSDFLSASTSRNYLRMRGEELLDVCHFYAVMELPPHARRRDHREHFR